MSIRNAVRAGVFDQRSRRTTRRRDSPRPAGVESESLQLKGWLREHLPEPDLSDLEQIDLLAWLRRTGHFAASPGERLRQLAVCVESLAIGEGRRGWRALHRIYAYALQLEPSNVEVLRSLATSARECVDERCPQDSSVLWETALSAIREGLAQKPNDANLHVELGLIHYFRGETDEALRAFGATLALDCANEWAQLYRAHCYHDLGQWQEALAAYGTVNLSRFYGPSAWRVDVLREQQAHCRLMGGDRAGALAEFDRILGRYEREPHVAFSAMSSSLWVSVKGELLEELGARAEAVDSLAVRHALRTS